jgi:putative transposase
MVTASTYRHELLFVGRPRLTLVCDTLLRLANALGWQLQAWAVLPNHYHFIGIHEERPKTLRTLVRRLHSLTAHSVNAEDGVPGRRVWFQYWETHLSFQRSYLARLNYVHHNPARHGLAADPTRYPWCSAAWFERSADSAFYRAVTGFPTDRLNVIDVDCRL